MHNKSKISGQVKNKFLNTSSCVSFYFIHKPANSLISF